MKYNRMTAVKYCAYALIMIAAYIIQTSRGTALSLWNGSLDVMPYLIAAIALFEGPYPGGIFGFFAGLMLGIHALSVEGLSALYLGLFGIIFGVIGAYYMRTILLSALFGGTICLLLEGVLSYIFYLALVHGMDIATAALPLAGELILSLPAGVIIFFVIKAVNKRFSEAE